MPVIISIVIVALFVALLVVCCILTEKENIKRLRDLAEYRCNLLTINETLGVNL